MLTFFGKFGENNSSLKNNLGNKTKKQIWHFIYKRIKHLPLLKLIDRDLIFYAEFEKKWYKRWYAIVSEITSRNTRFAWIIICSQPVHKRVNNFFEWTRALGFASLRLELVWHSKKIIHSFVNRSRTNKSSKSGIPGLYFTNNGVLSHCGSTILNINYVLYNTKTIQMD